MTPITGVLASRTDLADVNGYGSDSAFEVPTDIEGLTLSNRAHYPGVLIAPNYYVILVLSF